jgi:hypothetical protein
MYQYTDRDQSKIEKKRRYYCSKMYINGSCCFSSKKIYQAKEEQKNKNSIVSLEKSLTNVNI